MERKRLESGHVPERAESSGPAPGSAEPSVYTPKGNRERMMSNLRLRNRIAGAGLDRSQLPEGLGGAS